MKTAYRETGFIVGNEVLKMNGLRPPLTAPSDFTVGVVKERQQKVLSPRTIIKIVTATNRKGGFP